MTMSLEQEMKKWIENEDKILALLDSIDKKIQKWIKNLKDVQEKEEGLK
jgi:hypothetical protein